jgi:hypothetical protein
MPSKSKKQHNFMAAIAHSPEFAKKAGVPMSVGKDFNEADKGKKFRKGGTTNPSVAKIANPRVHHGQIQLPNVSLKKYSGFKEGGIMKHDDMKQDMAMDKKQDVSMIKKAFKQHDAQEHKGGKGTTLKLASGGKAGQLSKADGCATKGKSKGTFITMKGC